MPPRWPVVIPQASATAFGVPSIPSPPPAEFNWSAYADDSRTVRKLLHLLTGPEATRAKEILRRLGAVAQTPGIEWTVEVFSYSYRPLAFAVPDGTLFLSDTLMHDTSDDELAAAMAHLMGHVRYGHYRLVRVQVSQENPTLAETPQKKEVPAGTLEKKPAAIAQNKPNRAAVIALTTLADTLIISWDVFIIVGALAGTPAGGGGPAGALPPKEIVFSPVGTEDVENWLQKKEPDTESLKAAWQSRQAASLKTAWQSALAAQQRDLEANCLAAKYLAGIGIPPETLFEILMRSSLQPPFTLQVPSETTAFDEMYTTYINGAFDFGKMLDAGRIPELAASQPSAKHRKR
jgi:Peptidase family M48